MPQADLVHDAVMLWAAACERRTAQHKLRPPRADFADSSSEGVELSVSESTTNSSNSPSDHGSSTPGDDGNLETSSEGSSSHASVSLQTTVTVPVPSANVMPSTVPAQEHVCAWFHTLLESKPVLKRFANVLKKEGFDTKETLPYLSVDDMARLDIPMAVRRLLEDEKKQLAAGHTP